MIPDRYTQAGEQVSPALAWTNVPAGTVSFVLNMRDPDVARNKTSDDQVHWLVWGIPGTATGLPEGVPKGPVLADGSQQISASGQVYRGPGAPATGPRHHYTFELFALDTKIDVKAGGRRVGNPHGRLRRDAGAHPRQGRLRRACSGGHSKPGSRLRAPGSEARRSNRPREAGAKDTGFTWRSQVKCW